MPSSGLSAGRIESSSQSTGSIDGLLVRLYAVLCEAEGEPPDLPEFLVQYAGVPLRQRVDVLLFEHDHRWRSGEDRPFHWYAEHLPDLLTDHLTRLRLARQELDFLEARGEFLSPDELTARFPGVDTAQLMAGDDVDGASAVLSRFDRFEFRSAAGNRPVGVAREGSVFLTPSAFHLAANAETAVPPSTPSQASGTTWASLPPDVLRLVESEMYPVNFRAGEPLMREGEPGDSLMVVVEGDVEVSTGGKTILARLRGRQVFGEMALLTSEPRTADVIAISDVRSMVLPATAFHDLAARHPSLSLMLTSLIAQRLGQTGRADVLWGRTLGEHYEITGRLGRGGMAVVYDARDRRDGRRVALKMMSHRLVYDPAAREQFQVEADIIQSFDHPNICRMLGRFQEFHTYFMVVDFCDGMTLQQVLRRGGPLDEETARQTLGQVAAALAYAHGHGIVHRDIKPGNIMIGRDGRATLMDFGLAKNLADAPPAIVDAIVGTPRYMAPEQLVGTDVGPAADVFSLGLVAWDMLTGESLLPETDWIGLLRHHARWDPIRLDEAKPHVTPATFDFLTRSLQPEPELRRVDLESIAAWAEPIDIARLPAFASPFNRFA
jgi:CRP-like cAMP-binding protein